MQANVFLAENTTVEDSLAGTYSDGPESFGLKARQTMMQSTYLFTAAVGLNDDRCKVM